MPLEDRELSNWYCKNLEPHESMLRAWLQDRFSLGSAVDDIVQEAYLRAIKARDRGVLYSPKAFLFKVSRNLAIDYLRKKSKFSSQPIAQFEESNVIRLNESVPEMVSRNQEFEILKEAIQSLPERCREIFTMRRVYGIPQKEIAETLGLSRNTVSAQLTIGLRKCSEFFEKFEADGMSQNVRRK